MTKPQVRAFAAVLFLISVTNELVSEWQCQYQGTEHRLLSEVHFTDPWNGWCVGHCTETEPAVILKTTDGGEQWSQVPHGFELGHGWAVHFVDPMNGWVAGGDCAGEQHGWIIHTTNGGQTWESQIEYWSIPNTRFYSLFFADSQHGWAAVGGNYGRVYRTTNGGSYWEERWLPGVDPDTYVHGVHFENHDEGWAVGGHEWDSYSNGVICHSTDGGFTWERQGEEMGSILESVCLYDVWFVDSQCGWAVGGGQGGGKILHTNDGGANWYEQSCEPEPNDVRLGSVSFVDAQNGWVTGAEYNDEGVAVLRTDNGGLTWQMDPGVPDWPLDVRFNGVHFVDHTNGWVVGDNMRIVKYSEPPYIAVTSPGEGATWWIGDQETIQWNSVGTSGFVNIDISYDSGPWNSLAQNVEDYDGGIFVWSVWGPPNDHCVIRVIDVDGFPEGSSGVFEIGAPWINVDSPEEGDQWWIGEIEQIVWTSQHTSGELDIDISYDGAVSWVAVDSCVVDDGEYEWQVPDSSSMTCVIRITDVDGYPKGMSETFGIAALAALPPLNRRAFGLAVAGPNPFRGSTMVWCRLPASDCVDLAVYNLRGHRISTLYQGELPAGKWGFPWALRPRETSGTKPGVYVARLRTRARTIQRELVVLP